jgi:pyrroloquinoline quinone biosynthesis protein E
LLPTRRQIADAEVAVANARAAIPDSIEILYVISDYHESFPKPCMHGWGARHIVVQPDGAVLPCLAAAEITGLKADRISDRSLAEIWELSDAFTRFRGTAWMKEPCRTCSRRDVDFGGCRCQAFLITGDATRTDPVCPLSPDHHVVVQAVDAQTRQTALAGRVNPRPRSRAGDVRPVESVSARKDKP